MHEPKRLIMTRIVAKAAALDALETPEDAIVLRVAPDEVFVYPAADLMVDDEHAIVVTDASLAGVWIDSAESAPILERVVEWKIPSARPTMAQGMIAGIPGKLWLEDDRVLVICAAPYSAEMAERLH